MTQDALAMFADGGSNDAMDVTWLNRIGIILNFLAGFLMAPDLIGPDNLQKAEEQLERYLRKIQSFFIRVSGRFEIKPTDPHYWIWFMIFGPHYVGKPYPSEPIPVIPVFGLILSIPSIIYCVVAIILNINYKVWIYMIFSSLFFVCLLFIVEEIDPARVVDNIKNVRSTNIFLVFECKAIYVLVVSLIFIVGVGLYVSAILLWGAPVGFILVCIYWLPKFASTGLSHLLNQLKGDKRLAKFLLTVGILCFIIGNFLQLLATRE